MASTSWLIRRLFTLHAPRITTPTTYAGAKAYAGARTYAGGTIYTTPSMGAVGVDASTRRTVGVDASMRRTNPVARNRSRLAKHLLLRRRISSSACASNDNADKATTQEVPDSGSGQPKYTIDSRYAWLGKMHGLWLVIDSRYAWLVACN